DTDRRYIGVGQSRFRARCCNAGNVTSDDRSDNKQRPDRDTPAHGGPPVPRMVTPKTPREKRKHAICCVLREDQRRGSNGIRSACDPHDRAGRWNSCLGLAFCSMPPPDGPDRENASSPHARFRLRYVFYVFAAAVLVLIVAAAGMVGWSLHGIHFPS